MIPLLVSKSASAQPSLRAVVAGILAITAPSPTTLFGSQAGGDGEKVTGTGFGVDGMTIAPTAENSALAAACWHWAVGWVGTTQHLAWADGRGVYDQTHD